MGGSFCIRTRATAVHRQKPVVGVDPWSAQTGDARGEAPVEAEACTVSTHDSLRFDNEEDVGPAIPKEAQRHPNKPVAAFEAGSRMPALEDGKLLAQGEDLQAEIVAGAQEGAEGAGKWEDKPSADKRV